MKKTLFFALLAILALTKTYAQSLTLDIDNVRHDNTKVYIDYSIKVDVNGVKLYISYDGGVTFTGPLKHVSGDVGDMKSGSRTIVWNFMEEFGNLWGDNIRFKVTYEPSKFKNKFFITANAAIGFSSEFAPSYGVTFGHYKRHGWFVSLMSNFNFDRYGTGLKCDNNGVVNGTRPFYADETSFNRISVTGGALLRISKCCFIKLGAGVGVSQVNWRTTTGEWVKNKDLGATGVDVDAGLMFDINGFTLSFDVVSTNFKTAELKLGVGWAF